MHASTAARSAAWFCLLTLVLPVAITAAAVPQAIAGEAALLPLAAGAGPLEAKPAVRVLAESDEELTLEFTLPALIVQPVEVDGVTYQALEFDGCGVVGEVGDPALPAFGRLVRIPDQAAVTVEVEAVETRELSGYRPFPVQGEEAAGGFALNPGAYAGSGFGAAERVRIGKPALARGLRVVPISFGPVRYDPSRETIEVASRIEVRVRFSGIDPRNTPVGRPQVLARSFDNLFRALVVNYDGPPDGREVGFGTYVIVCPNDAAVLSRLAPLVEWRTRRGQPVYVATTSETGTSKESIQTWLRTAYQTWPNPPEFVALVGDASGTIAIPCWSENYTYYHGNTDFPYSQLDGDDALADVHLGRISVDSYDRLQMYVSDKIVPYESSPYMGETDWYTHATLVGDPSSSKITCVQVMQWIKRRLLELSYTEVDTVFSSPFVSQMSASLNEGSTIFCYRGWLGMSQWTTGNVEALTNGRQLVYAVNLTCGTGNYSSSTSMSEAWMRAGAIGAPKAGIASIGTATSGTHTRYNNSVTQGVWRGLLWEDMRTFGESLTRGKYEMYVSYWNWEATKVFTYCSWNNLMGDPGGVLWTAVPAPISVSHPAQIGIGANALAVEVESGGQPLAGALVSLWQDPGIFVQGYTDASGHADLPLDATTAGTLKVTVTAHNHQPYLANVSVAQAARFAAYEAHLIDDDANDSSDGNADGKVNPTETIEIPLELHNHGSQIVSGVTATLTSSDPYVMILDGEESFGDIPAGGDAWSLDDFDIAIAADAPHDREVVFGLEVHCGAETWHSQFVVPVTAPAFRFDVANAYGFGPRIDPGEAGEVSVKLTNTGGTGAAQATGHLSSRSGWVLVTDAEGTFPAAEVGASTENTADLFGVFVSPEAYLGHLAPMLLVLETADGAVDSVEFKLALAPGAVADPGGPDGYGYYFLDNTDIAYPAAPVYEWIEIAPNHGGPGVSCGLNDFGDWQDDSEVFTLPFPFQFYGETFTKVTICSNGWIAMGSTHMTTGQNWPIPDAAAPNYFIAAMWDDLIQYSSDRVYHYFDADGHRYIIQWSRLRNHVGDAIENFEIILYDPVYYPTETGDGEIVFQYHTFNNADGTNQFCTVGIQNGDQSDGLQYAYYNQHHPNAAPVQAGRAIKFLVPASGDASHTPEVPVAGALPARLALYAGAPNPFGGSRGATTIRFDLPAAAKVSLEVCDVAGRRVATLLRDDLAPGSYAIPWSGLDHRSQPLESGVYFTILEAGGERASGRVMLLR